MNSKTPSIKASNKESKKTSNKISKTSVAKTTSEETVGSIFDNIAQNIGGLFGLYGNN